MRRILAIAAIPVALAAIAACSSSPAGTGATTPAATTAAAPVSASPEPTLGPLALGHFPSTTDGRLAKAICGQWQELRGQYAGNVVNDPPVQLNQWFSSPAWKAVQADAAKLGNDPVYANLETALGVGMVGDTASIATAQEIDKACAAG